MKIIIFAGGSGRRLWPLSRQRSPKQFEPIIGDQSTLQLAVARVEDAYGAENIFVSTNERYLELIARQLPQLPAGNLIGEPARRDLAAAVGLAMIHVTRAAGRGEPVAILWGDNTMSDVPTFLSVMARARKLLQQGRASLIFIGETPRFANDNLGWIELGDEAGAIEGQSYFEFASLVYRPPLADCQRMFDGGRHVWNTGYFVTTPGFITGAYERYQPAMWRELERIGAAIGTPEYENILHTIYPQLPALSFDNAILECIDPAQALVMHGQMGWSDPGTLYALKEALSKEPVANVIKGLVRAQDVGDSLLYNLEEDKLMAVIGVEGLIVVNMEDALLVVHKDSIPAVKALVNGLEGSDLEKYS